MSARPRVLVVDDDPIVCEALDQLLRHEGYEVCLAQSASAATEALQGQAAEVVLLDLKLRQEDGLHLLPRLKTIRPETSFIILTAFGTIEAAVEAMRRGADDFVEKPVDPKRLLVVLEKGRESHRLRRLAARVQRDTPREPALIAGSASMRSLLTLAETVARHDATVLLYGETGTGKSLIARYLHRASHRSTGPFVDINCAGIPRELAESELFGHEKGAFTGASERKVGLFEAGDGGTLFLDEIGDLDLATQAKLLQVVESRRFRRVGGVSEIQVDVRLMAATNRRLEQAMAENRFRADLFYRLNTFTLEVPALRDRREDVLPLALHLLGEAGGAGAKGAGISPEAQSLLLEYAWPGNVRELRNVMERAAILCPRGSDVLPFHLPFLGQASIARMVSGPAAAGIPPSAETPPSISEASAEAERDALVRALHHFGGRLDATARGLGVSRATLYRKLKKHGIDVPRNSMG